MRSTKTTQQQKCSRCGMGKSEWTGNEGRGIAKGEEIYCCDDCAENTGCICG